MPLFTRRKQGVNPTRFWVGDTRFPLEVDFDRHTLSGVAVGGAVDKLMRLGPAEDAEAAANGVLSYFSRGIEIIVDAGFIRSYRLIWEGDSDFRRFTGTCLRRGTLVNINGETTESQALKLFGPQYWRLEDGDGIILYYEHGEIEWQLIFSPHGTLDEWVLRKPPDLSEEHVRRRCGVNKPWPPK